MLLNFNMGGISSSTLGTSKQSPEESVTNGMGSLGSDRLKESQQKRKLSNASQTIRNHQPN
jgi:hypothetical protein